MKIIAVTLVVLLTGCSTIKDMIPSFWDPNQAQKIVDVRQQVLQLDCKQPQHPQAKKIYGDIEWFELYSQSRDHRDMLRLIQPMKETAKEFVDRTKEKDASEMYCKLKKDMLDTQSSRAAKAVLGRF